MSVETSSSDRPPISNPRLTRPSPYKPQRVCVFNVPDLSEFPKLREWGIYLAGMLFASGWWFFFDAAIISKHTKPGRLVGAHSTQHTLTRCRQPIGRCTRKDRICGLRTSHSVYSGDDYCQLDQQGAGEFVIDRRTAISRKLRSLERTTSQTHGEHAAGSLWDSHC